MNRSLETKFVLEASSIRAEPQNTFCQLFRDADGPRQQAPDLVQRILQQARLGAPAHDCPIVSAVFGENVSAAMRSGFESLVRYIATPTTAEKSLFVSSCNLSQETELSRAGREG
jgi:hypothetical protein